MSRGRARRYGPVRATWLGIIGAILVGLTACELVPTSGPALPPTSALHSDVVVSLAKPAPEGAAPESEPPSTAPVTGRVWRWGRYEKPAAAMGERGPGLVTTSPAAPGMVAIATASHRSIGLDDSGAVWEWTEMIEAARTGRTPALVRWLPAASPRVTAIAAGDDHFLALREDGEVWAWGRNELGQLGDGSRQSRLEPAPVLGLKNVASIAAGSHHSLALARDGTVQAWGSGGLGELGDGLNNGSLVPVVVSGLADVKAIAGGGRHSLAVTADGSVWAWGYTLLATTPEFNAASLLPTRVEGIPDAISVAGGWNHSLVLTATGRVWAWGYNVHGEIGFPPDLSLSIQGPDILDWIDLPVGTPREVPKLDRIVAIAAGEHHNVVLRSDGSVWTWGSNLQGELGSVRPGPLWSQPGPVPGLRDVTAISAWGNWSLALQGPPRSRLPAPQFVR